jgi:hypothetical protein
MGERLPLMPVQPPVTGKTGDRRSWQAGVDRIRQHGAVRPTPRADEQCEFCSAGLDREHGHLVDLSKRTLLCVCRPCYLLFSADGAGGSTFRAVPTRYVLLSAFDTAGEHWNALDVPIGLAFFFRNSVTGKTTAFYPSPAGATESELALDSWEPLVQAVEPLATMRPDVEALLVRRTALTRTALIVPIDVCYELVGRIRLMWRGLQGGDDLWREVDAFFARLNARATGAMV